MKRIILMRHAKSDWSTGHGDKARPLNDRGIRSARALGDWLRKQGHAPDEALISSSTRTRQSWELLGIALTARFEDALYLADPDALLRVLKTARGETVLLMAHNPGIADFAHWLVAEPPEHDRFEDYPTGATLVADFEIQRWSELPARSGRVVDFIVPRALI